MINIKQYVELELRQFFLKSKNKFACFLLFVFFKIKVFLLANRQNQLLQALS